MQIGLIGGLSPVSTIEYYKVFNQLAAKRLGVGHSAAMHIATVDFGLMTELAPQGRWDLVTEGLLGKGQQLVDAGCDVLMLGSNTVHRTVPDLQERLQKPILHIAACLGQSIRAQGFSKVGLLGTKDLMTCAHYRSVLQQHFHLEVLTPPQQTHSSINRIIFSEFCRDITKTDSLEYLYHQGRDLAEKGADCLILGCTELEIFLSPAQFPMPVFFSLAEHVKAASALAFGEHSQVPLVLTYG